MIVVVDARVAVMWFLQQSLSERAALLLNSRHDLVAPALIRLEVANALSQAV
jgi:predicted nucleic acid-binding protein